MLAESLLGKMCSCCDSNIFLEEETVRGGEGGGSGSEEGTHCDADLVYISCKCEPKDMFLC